MEVVHRLKEGWLSERLARIRYRFNGRLFFFFDSTVHTRFRVSYYAMFRRSLKIKIYNIARYIKIFIKM